jgi:hypothetical protein
MFFIIAVSLVLLAGAEFFRAITTFQDKELINGIVRAINTAFIALATFELGIGIDQEYSGPGKGDAVYPAVRRMVTRFVSVTCIALVLESLILVIKYSQLEMAGNLPYPVAVMAGAGMLLIGLGIFMHFTRADAPERVHQAAESASKQSVPDFLRNNGVLFPSLNRQMDR